MRKPKNITDFLLADAIIKYCLIRFCLLSSDFHLNRKTRRALLKQSSKLEDLLPQDFEPFTDTDTIEDVENALNNRIKGKAKKAIKLGKSVVTTTGDNQDDIEMVNTLEDFTARLNDKELITMSSKQEKRKRALLLAELTDKSFQEKNYGKLTKSCLQKCLNNLEPHIFLVTLHLNDKREGVKGARQEMELFRKRLKANGLNEVKHFGALGFAENQNGLHYHQIFLVETKAQLKTILSLWTAGGTDAQEIKGDDFIEQLERCIFYIFKNASEAKQKGFKTKNFASYFGTWDNSFGKRQYNNALLEQMATEIDDYLLSHGIDALKTEPATISGKQGCVATFYIPEDEWQAIPIEIRQGVASILAKYRN